VADCLGIVAAVEAACGLDGARWYSAFVWYELWDGETGNRVGRYESEQAALAAVAEDVGRYGPDSDAVQTLGLLRRDPTT
jgi:hypothetical protein